MSHMTVNILHPRISKLIIKFIIKNNRIAIKTQEMLICHLRICSEHISPTLRWNISLCNEYSPNTDLYGLPKESVTTWWKPEMRILSSDCGRARA